MPFMDKSPEMQKMLNDLAQSSFGRTVSEALKQEICVSCGESPFPFRSVADRNEYYISGMCEGCWDTMFDAIIEDE